MVTKSMRDHNRRNSQDQNAIYEVLLRKALRWALLKPSPYKHHNLTKCLTIATATGRTVKMEVEYLSEMSESLYQNARCHTPHHRNTETMTFVTGREEK